jgi:hypothetical protein
MTMAIIDKAQPASAEDDEGALAGMVSCPNTVEYTAYLSTEIGTLWSHLAAVSAQPHYHLPVALMLFNMFDSVQDGGMGFRRVKWPGKHHGRRLGPPLERMGFRWEGVLR